MANEIYGMRSDGWFSFKDGHTVPVTPPSTTRRFPGDPGQGKILYGMSLNMTSTGQYANPNQWEQATGGDLSLFRRYYQSTQITDFVNDVANDTAANRLTWASFKLPTSWAGVANGSQDAWLNDLATAAAGVTVPVWVCLHHEPIGDGQPASDFTAMYAHAAPILHQAPNLALTPILNGSAFNSQPDMSVWFTPDADVIGYDYYNQWWTYNTAGGADCDSPSIHEGYRKWRTAEQVIGQAAMLQAWGKPVGLAEHGVHMRYQSQDAGVSAQWVRDTYDLSISQGLVGLSYFNSGNNSPRGAWDLNRYRIHNSGESASWCSSSWSFDTSREQAFLEKLALPSTVKLSDVM